MNRGAAAALAAGLLLAAGGVVLAVMPFPVERTFPVGRQEFGVSDRCGPPVREAFRSPTARRWVAYSETGMVSGRSGLIVHGIGCRTAARDRSAAGAVLVLAGVSVVAAVRRGHDRPTTADH